MDDLQIARKRLKEKKLSLVFVKDSKPIFETSTEGLRGFLQAIEKLDNDLSGVSVADRVIGRAAALLCAYSKVTATFAITLSKSGLEVLKTHSIRYEYENLVLTILNMKKTDRCPFEKLVEKIADPTEAHEKIRQFCRY